MNCNRKISDYYTIHETSRVVSVYDTPTTPIIIISVNIGRVILLRVKGPRAAPLPGNNLLLIGYAFDNDFRHSNHRQGFWAAY